VREVHRWAWTKKLTLNLKKCEVSFFSADPHKAKWRPVVEVEETILRFNPTPLFLGVGLGRILSGKGIRVLKALSGTDWGWSGNLLRKVYQTSLLSGATYAEGGWLSWLFATSVDTLNWAQNCNLRVLLDSWHQCQTKP
jgi:hypothetical protein